MTSPIEGLNYSIRVTLLGNLTRGPRTYHYMPIGYNWLWVKVDGAASKDVQVDEAAN